MRGLRGRRYLVAGGGSGIGEATAARLAEEGALVAVADRNAEAAAGVAARIGAGAAPFSYEQSDPASVARLFEQVAAGGPIHGVALVAGVHPGSIPLAHITAEEFTRVHEVNARGVLIVLQHAVPALEPDGRGSIVVVSSVAGIRPVQNDAVYASSKAAAQAVVRSVALEVAHLGIRVNSVLPGSAITPLALSQSPLEEIERGAREAIPMRRPSSAAEVASAIAFLLSDDASSITGTELIVDGGLAAGRPS